MAVYEVKLRHYINADKSGPSLKRKFLFKRQRSVGGLFRAIESYAKKHLTVGAWSVISIVELPETQTAKES